MSEQAENAEGTWGDETAEVHDGLEATGSNEHTIAFKSHGKDETATYDWTRLTPKLEKRLLAGDTSTENVTEFVATLIVSWSLTDRKGSPVPVTDDGIENVSFQTLYAVSNSVMLDVFPNLNADAA